MLALPTSVLRDETELHSILIALYAFQAPADDQWKALSRKEQILVSQSIGVAIDALRVASNEAISVNDQFANAGITNPNEQAVDAITRALINWRSWFQKRFPGFNQIVTQNSAWNPHRMEYQFSVQSSVSNIELEAERYTGDHLDWYAFNGKLKTEESSNQLLNLEEPESPSSGLNDKKFKRKFQKLNLMPTPLLLPGQPASRWWQFEDRQVGFGDFNTGSADLATLLLLEYAVAYGED